MICVRASNKHSDFTSCSSLVTPCDGFTFGELKIPIWQGQGEKGVSEKMLKEEISVGGGGIGAYRDLEHAPFWM